MMAVEFGAYLKKIRKDRGLTAKLLGEKLGVSQSYISQLEGGTKGIPSPEMITKISKALNFDYVELMIYAGYIQSDLIYTFEQTLIGRLYREVKAFEGEDYLRKLQKEYILRTNQMPFGSEIEVVYNFYAQVGTPGDILELIRLNMRYDIETAALVFKMSEKDYISLEKTTSEDIKKISQYNEIIKENFGISDFEAAFKTMIGEARTIVEQIQAIPSRNKLVDVNIKQFSNDEVSNDLAKVLSATTRVTIDERVLNNEERLKALQILKLIFD